MLKKSKKKKSPNDNLELMESDSKEYVEEEEESGEIDDSNSLSNSEEEISSIRKKRKLEEDKIMDFSKALNDALEKLQKNAGGGMRNQQSSGFNNNNKAPQGSGLLEKIIGGIIGLFNPNDSLLLLVGFFVVFYLFLRQIRKWFDNSEKIKNKVNKSNKVKKKTK